MPIYDYKGLDKSGKEIKGTISSDAVAMAKQRLRQSGIMLFEIKEQKSVANLKKKSNALAMINHINVSDLALMTRQFATLIRAKIQIVDALTALTEQSEKPQMRIILSEVKQKVNEGVSLAKAMADYPHVFDTIYTNMVEAGEASGTLEVVLLRLAEFTEGQVKLRNKIKSALTYPIIMMTVGTFMIGLIFVFIIPKITKIFITMKKTLPLQTQICIWISAFLKGYWWLVILMLIGAYFAFKQYIKTENGRANWDGFTLKLPIFGKLIMMINVSRFCATLATLLNSSVPIIASMKIVKNLITNVHMQRAVAEAQESVAEGASMTGPLIKSKLFPPMVTHMIVLGEKAGEVEPMLQIIAENYTDEVNNKLNGLTSILEPIMMVCMGAVVAFVIFSVIVPMMDLNSIK